MPEPSRRRSERIPLVISIRVEGKSAKGRQFSEMTRTLEINRQGARIFLKDQVTPGTALRIVNLKSSGAAMFRVVRATKSMTELGGEWAVDSLDAKQNIWGIEFPP
jgi:hypothetical protein